MAHSRQVGDRISAKLCQAAGLICVVVLVGCATTPPPEEPRPPVFYPPLPNPPRIQYLTSFSSEKDLNPTRQTRFAEFIVGEVREENVAIEKPYGVALFQGKLYVVDTRGPGYAVFDLENQEFRFVSGSGAGKMQKPINITIDQDGTKYITDTGRNQILAFDQEDRFLRAYGVLDQFKPGDVLIAGDHLYVSDLDHHTIQVLDKRSGEVLFEFGETGSKENQLFWPTNMAMGPDGDLYITDTGNFRIFKFTLDGNFIQSHGILGTGLGQFARPKGIALDREGRIYVVDAAFQNVQVFTPEWELLLFFGEPGGSPENINLPTAVVIDYDSASLFQKYADPQFQLEYVILVASQFGRSKVNIFGFGKMEGMDYSTGEQAETKQP